MYLIMESLFPDNMLRPLGRKPVVRFGGLSLAESRSDTACVEIAILVQKINSEEGLFLLGYAPRYALLQFMETGDFKIFGGEGGETAPLSQFAVTLVSLDLALLS